MRKPTSAPLRNPRVRENRVPDGLRRLLLMVALVALSAGCSLLRAPQQMVTAVVPGERSKQPDPVDVQLQVQRFADDYTTRTGEAIDEYARLVGTIPARLEALQWKLGAASAAIAIASGPNPTANLLDLVAVATLTRLTLEDFRSKGSNGPAFERWLQTSRSLQTNAWNMVDGVLKPAQIEELRQAIRQWQAHNSAGPGAMFARPQELAALVRTRSAKESDLNSVFSLVGLDPTSGLDPAVREVTRTRLFTERALYVAQRMPFLLRWQTELLAGRLSQVPEVQWALTNTTRLRDSADRISHATEQVSQTAAQLPDRISAERKAILAALEQQEGKLRDLAAEIDRSLVSGEKMSTSLNTTLTTFDALMKRFGVGEPTTNSPPDTNSPPFNILDYGKVATQVGAMAKELSTLVVSVDQNVPKLASLGQQSAADAGRVVERAFRLGMVLMGVLWVGCLLTALGYRFLANKLNRAGPLPPTAKA